MTLTQILIKKKIFNIPKYLRAVNEILLLKIQQTFKNTQYYTYLIGNVLRFSKIFVRNVHIVK